MTCALLTPWWLRENYVLGSDDVAGSVAATPILDTRSAPVRALSRLAAGSGASESSNAHADRELVRVAHGWLAEHVRPVYGVEERTRASVVLARGRGSCSQRLAVLEAVARAGGIRTRVRGLEVEGAFWYPRFPGLHRVVPSTVVVAWPEMRVDGVWSTVDALLAPANAHDHAAPFTNAGRETLFDAVARTRIDWVGCSLDSACTVQGHVRRDLGLFDSRDELFDRHGQTLHLLARRALDPVLGRWSPAA